MFGIVLMGITYSLNKLNVSKRKINAISLIFLVIIVLITGFSASVIRACVMASIQIFARILL
ncbi:MAG: hypothetical protein HFJ23_02985 [Clostridia bacterium]|nr:hypothetical protein [Clostridia bacterium]